MKDMRTSTSTGIGSIISNPLCQMSTNLQRISHEPISFRDGSLSKQKSKRRHLKMASKLPAEDGSWYDTTPAIPEPSASFMTALGDKSNKSAEVHKGTVYPPRSMTESHHFCHFRSEIRLELLELRHKLDEVNDLYSLRDAECATRCTLEIFVANYEDTPTGTKLKCGEDLWRDQQTGIIRTICDNYSHDATQVILPRPFIIPAGELLVKRPSSAVNPIPAQCYRLDLAHQYVIKIWLEAPNSDSRWPPLELISSFEHNGRMQKWLHEGTFCSGDIRLCCKGVLFPEGGDCNGFDMVLKLGGLQIRTCYTLRFDVQYSLAPQVCERPSTPTLQEIETPGEIKGFDEYDSPHLANRTHHLSISEAEDRNVEEYEPATKDSRKSSKLPPPLTVPRTKGRLCDALIKNVFIVGEELDIIDEKLETSWRTAKHVARIEDNPDIRSDAKDYILKWDSFVTSLMLSSNYYVPQALLTFVNENKNWFAQRRARITEFSLHATSLRLRGSIDIECFAKCINLLQDCIEGFNISDDKTNRETKTHGSTTATNDEHSTNGDIFDDQKGKLRMENGKYADKEACNEDSAAGELIGDEVVDRKQMIQVSVDRLADNEEDAGQDEVLGHAINKDTTGEIQRLKPHRDAEKDAANEEAVYEDASEVLEVPEIDDYFDAENGESIPDHPFYFQSYRQSIAQRWPHIKLHHPDNFGIATVIAAIAIFQGFPNDNIDRLIALHIHHCPNENIQDLTHMYYNAEDVVPVAQGVCLTELKLHKIMWEAGRDKCEVWLTDVYREEGGTRRTVREAIEIATNAGAWDELWKCIARECSGWK